MNSHGRIAASLLLVLSQVLGSAMVLCDEGVARQRWEFFSAGCCETVLDAGASPAPGGTPSTPCDECKDVSIQDLGALLSPRSGWSRPTSRTVLPPPDALVPPAVFAWATGDDRSSAACAADRVPSTVDHLLRSVILLI